MQIEGTLVEIGNLDGNVSLPGLRVEVGDTIIELSGITRNDIKGLPNLLFKRVVITVEAVS